MTLDTDVVRDVWDEDDRRGPIETIVSAAHEGLVSLAVTRHIHQDIPGGALVEKINSLPELAVIEKGGVFQLGVSALGGRDGLGSGEFQAWWQERTSARGPSEPKRPGDTDYLHLHAHYISGRDVFVTWDKAILRLAPELEKAFAIRVATPTAALELISKRGA
jgi:hypothetical protein